jgi:hypothetical protein
MKFYDSRDFKRAILTFLEMISGAWRMIFGYASIPLIPTFSASLLY